MTLGPTFRRNMFPSVYLAVYRSVEMNIEQCVTAFATSSRHL